MGPLCPCHPLLQPHTLHGATWKPPLPPTQRPCRIPLGNSLKPIEYMGIHFSLSFHFCPQVTAKLSALPQASQHRGHGEPATGALSSPWLQLHMRVSGPEQAAGLSVFLHVWQEAMQGKNRPLEQACFLTHIVIWP